MGSAGEDLHGEDEQIRQAEIVRPFYLGVFPVTQGQFRRVTRRTPSRYRPGGENPDLLPVENVTWTDAFAFCEALSARKGEKQAGLTYRLPSEAEWEYACRAAGTSLDAFAFGPTLSSHQANFDGEHPFGTDVKGPSLGHPTEVGSYLPNAFGLYDLHGNVWEWCQDGYRREPRTRPARRGTRAARTGLRIVRGGAYYNYAAWCRSARRCSVEASRRHGHVGFRVAADFAFTSPRASGS